MKDIILTKDFNGGAISGFTFTPHVINGCYVCGNPGNYYTLERLTSLGIDVTKFPVTPETPIRIRQIWEQVHETI